MICVKNIISDIKYLIQKIKELDKKIVIILMSVAILQTVSYYFTSRRFFRANLFESFQNYSQPYLIEFVYWFVGWYV